MNIPIQICQTRHERQKQITLNFIVRVWDIFVEPQIKEKESKKIWDLKETCKNVQTYLVQKNICLFEITLEYEEMQS